MEKKKPQKEKLRTSICPFVAFDRKPKGVIHGMIVFPLKREHLKNNRYKFVAEYLGHIDEDEEEPMCYFCHIEALGRKIFEIKQKLEDENTSTTEKKVLKEDYFKLKNKMHGIAIDIKQYILDLDPVEDFYNKF